MKKKSREIQAFYWSKGTLKGYWTKLREHKQGYEAMLKEEILNRYV